MFYPPEKNQALFQNTALGLASIFIRSMNPLGSIESLIPSFQNTFEDTPMQTQGNTDSPEQPAQSSSFSLFSGLPEKIAQNGMYNLFFAVTAPVFTNFGSQASTHTNMGNALTVASNNLIPASQLSASSSFGFFESAFESATETPLQQSMMPSAYQLTIICLALAAVSMAAMSLYNSYKKCGSGCNCCGCTATATATATATTDANTSEPVTATTTATAIATCSC